MEGANRRRVIIDTDAKNEADDQFAIVHALLSPSLDVRGLIAAHFGTSRSDRSMEESREEIDLLLHLMSPERQVRVANGAPSGISDEHFATYKDRYATEGYGPPVGLLEQIDKAGAVGDLSVVDLNWPFAEFDGSLDDVKAALERNRLRAVAITPEIYTRDYIKGSITNPDPAVRSQALKLLNEATELAKELDCDYVKLWFGQDGWDYPFQVDYHDISKLAVDGLRELVSAHPEIKFVIEYKPREPRNKIIFPNAARTLLAIQQVGLDNLGILLDFGHSLYGLETPADAAQLCIDAGRLFAIDVNDNFRGWDDDMVVGSVHLVETFEFFYTLRKNNWDGVWQLDQFPFREDSVEAAKAAIRFLKALHGALDALDEQALREAQASHDALAAQRLIQQVLLSSMAGAAERQDVGV